MPVPTRTPVVQGNEPAGTCVHNLYSQKNNNIIEIIIKYITDKFPSVSRSHDGVKVREFPTWIELDEKEGKV